MNFAIPLDLSGASELIIVNEEADEEEDSRLI